MPVSGLAHFLVATDDIAATRDWYCGCWASSRGRIRTSISRCAGSMPTVATWCISRKGRARPDPTRRLTWGGSASAPPATGALDHVAFHASGLEASLERLKRHGVEYFERRADDQALYQVFCYDPNGIKVELNFPAAEAVGRVPGSGGGEAAAPGFPRHCLRGRWSGGPRLVPATGRRLLHRAWQRRRIRRRQCATNRALEGEAVAEDGEARLADCGVVRRYRKGHAAHAGGDAGDTVYVIRSGSAKVFSEDQQGAIVYNLLGPGDYIGEMSLDGGPRSASVITLEPTECAVLSRQQVRAFMAAHPEFAFELLCTLIRRARDATEKGARLAQDSVYARLKAYFERTAAPLRTERSWSNRP